MDPMYRIDDRNLQCVCWKPNHSTKIPLSDTESFRLEGYAYNGAGRPVHRVEVTLNGGRNWRLATRVIPEEPTEYGRLWCWIFWHLDIPVKSLANAGEICVRCWDDSQNCMPALPTWNLMGMMNNPWFRIKIHRVPGEEAIWFEHPTRVEPTAATVYPYGETMHLVNGEVASPGWAERMQKEYSFAYMPKEKDDEEPDPDYAWEAEASHKLKGLPITTKVRGPARKFETIKKAELEAHGADNWMAIHGLVYDVTRYLPEHPGGAQIMIPLNGKDATNEFEEAGHTMLSRREVDRLVLKGVLEGYEENIAYLQSLGWVEDDGIPTVAQVAAINKHRGQIESDLETKSVRKSKFVGGVERPVTLNPKEKIPLKLAKKNAAESRHGPLHLRVTNTRSCIRLAYRPAHPLEHSDE
jgi:nitrate reductase (NAD(P)H)